MPAQVLPLDAAPLVMVTPVVLSGVCATCAHPLGAHGCPTCFDVVEVAYVPEFAAPAAAPRHDDRRTRRVKRSRRARLRCSQNLRRTRRARLQRGARHAG